MNPFRLQRSRLANAALVLVLVLVLVLGRVLLLGLSGCDCRLSIMRHSIDTIRAQYLLAFIGFAGEYPLSGNQRIEARRTLERRTSRDVQEATAVYSRALSVSFRNVVRDGPTRLVQMFARRWFGCFSVFPRAVRPPNR